MTKIELNDLLDASDVASLLGLSTRTSVSVYKARYPDFPRPVISKNSGKCELWARADVEQWAKGRQPRNVSGGG